MSFAGCGLYFHDDGVEQQTSKALSTFQSGGLSQIGANTLGDQANAFGAETVAYQAYSNALRRYDIARLLGDTSYITAECARSHLAGNNCALEFFRHEINQRRDWLAKSAVHTDSNWRQFLDGDFTSPAQVAAVYVAQAAQDYKNSGRTDFTSCATFADPHEETGTSLGERLFQACRPMIPTPADDSTLGVLRNATASEVRGEIVKVTNSLAQKHQRSKAVEASESQMAVQLDQAKQALKNAQQSGTDADPQKALQKLNDLLKGADAAANAIGETQDAPGTRLAAIKFRKVTLLTLLSATNSTAPTSASGASGASATSAAGASEVQAEYAIAGLITGTEEMATGRTPGQAPPPSLQSLQLLALTGEEKALQAQIDAVNAQVTALEQQQRAYLIEFVLLNAASDAVDEADHALTKAGCKAANVSDLLSAPGCASAREPVARALALYSMSWTQGRLPGGAANIELPHQEAVESEARGAAEIDARVQQDTIALTALAGAGKSGINPATIASTVQALATVVIAARIH